MLQHSQKSNDKFGNLLAQIILISPLTLARYWSMKEEHSCAKGRLTAHTLSTSSWRGRALTRRGRCVNGFQAVRCFLDRARACKQTQRGTEQRPVQCKTYPSHGRSWASSRCRQRERAASSTTDCDSSHQSQGTRSCYRNSVALTSLACTTAGQWPSDRWAEQGEH